MSVQFAVFGIIPGRRFILLPALLGLSLFFAGCEDDRFDHDPPPGKGTLYVDNRTGDDIRVFINGTRFRDVDGGDLRYYDLDPGVYRVVLDGEDTPRSFAGDVDLLVDRKTIMEVRLMPDDYRRFDVLIYYR